MIWVNQQPWWNSGNIFCYSPWSLTRNFGRFFMQIYPKQTPAMEHPTRLLWAPPGKISFGEFLALGVHGRHFTVLRCLFWNWFIYDYLDIIDHMKIMRPKVYPANSFILQFPDEWAAMFRVRYPTDHQSLQHSTAVIPLGSQEKLYAIAKYTRYRDTELTDVWYCRKPFSNQPIYSIQLKGPGAWFWLVCHLRLSGFNPQLLDCFINWVPPWIVGSPFLQHQTGLHLPILDNFGWSHYLNPRKSCAFSPSCAPQETSKKNGAGWP